MYLIFIHIIIIIIILFAIVKELRKIIILNRSKYFVISQK